MEELIRDVWSSYDKLVQEEFVVKPSMPMSYLKLSCCFIRSIA